MFKGSKKKMIPFYISIPCVILSLIVVCHWLLTEVDWEDTFKRSKEIAIQFVILACGITAIISTLQWLIYFIHSVKE